MSGVGGVKDTVRNLLIYLKGRLAQREREESFYLLVHFSHRHNGQGARNSFHIYCIGGEAQRLESFSATSPGTLAENWIRSRAAST